MRHHRTFPSSPEVTSDFGNTASPGYEQGAALGLNGQKWESLSEELVDAIKIMLEKLDQLAAQQADLERRIEDTINRIRALDAIAEAGGLVEPGAVRLATDNQRLHIDLDKKYILLDDKPFPCTEEQCLIMQALVDAKGNWKSSTEIRAANPLLETDRIDRHIKGLPKPIHSLIERQRGKGYRLRFPGSRS